MNTKIKLVGGGYFDKKNPVWSGELPILHSDAGMKLLVINDDIESLFSVTSVCIELSGSDAWQVVYVQALDKNTGRLLTESAGANPR